MRAWRALTDGLRSLIRRPEVDEDLSDELRHFMDEADADLVSRGATPTEARRAVRLRYGDPLTAREEVRGYGWEAGVDRLVTDLRLSLRSLVRSPAHTAVVALTLGVGVGATVAILSAALPVLFQPLAYPNPERVVSVADRAPDGTLAPTPFGTYRELLLRSRVFDALAVWRPWQPTLTGGDEPARAEGQGVTASYFDVLGVGPALGPGFDPAEDRPGGARQVLLDDRLWQERFGSDPGVVGRSVRLDGEPSTVVGVMPEGFENVTSPEARLWTLLRYDPTPPSFDTREWGRHLEMIGRLRPGLSRDEARSALDRVAGAPIAEMPRPYWAQLDGGFSLRLLKDAVTADVAPTLWILLGAAALLIAATCANLTIVLLARGARRRSEFAMRLALGAPRGRLARYLVTESLVLAALGGALGVAVAHLGLTFLMAAAPPALPRAGAVGLDGPAVVLGFVLTALAGVVFGLAPGLHRATPTTSNIREAGHGSVRRGRATRKALVVAEVALATVLLVGAGLLVRSAQRLFAQPIGLNAAGVAVMQVHATGLQRGDAATHRFFEEALAAVRAVPGVTSAAMTTQLPLSGYDDRYGVVPDDVNAVERQRGAAERYAVAPAYFTTMGVSVLQGRPLTEEDVAGTPRAAVVSRSLAGRLFANENALGQRIRVGDPRLEPYSIVGIAEDVKHRSLADGPSEIVYVTTQQWHWADRVRWIVVRAASDATGLVPAVRRAIWSVDDEQPVVRAQSMADVVARSEARRSFVLIILMAFAGSALAVAGVGLFGVLSGAVAERTREMGVRAALGASRPLIVSMIVRQGLALAAAGVVVGIAVAAALSDVLASLLFEVSRLDPFTYVGVVVILGVGAVVASMGPAMRAGRADPMTALRSE